MVGDPVAVEAERDPGRQVHPRHRLAGEVLRGEQHQVRGAALGVVDERQHVAVVFPGAGGGGREYRLTGGGVRAELVRFGAAVARSCLSSAFANAPSAKSPLSETVFRLTSPMEALYP